MAQPPVPWRGAGAEPAPDAGLPGGAGGAGGRSGRDPRLAGFGQGGAGDACSPGPGLAKDVAELSGPEWRCAGATDDELVGLLGRWQAVESWAAAGKLGVVRELIRRRARPGPRGQDAPAHGDLPDAWEEGLGHEISAALAVSLRTADRLIDLAWTLRARLPGIGVMLAGGTIDLLKARIVADELSVLDDEAAARAEELILGELAGKTPGQIGKLAARAACMVDPEGARKRRECAEREDARVRFWRENTGTSALAAYGLPTDAALAAHANVNARAEEYKTAKASPGATMDQLRVLAYLDLLNGISLAARIAQTQAGDASLAGSRPGDDEPDGEPGNSGPGDSGHGDSGHGDSGPGGDPSGGGDARPGDEGSGDEGSYDLSPAGGHVPALPARTNLTIPLSTLLGLAERPGEGHGLGPLDPALARDLADTAAASPLSEWCVTVTDPSGVAIGHGCARPARTRQAKSPPAGNRDGPPARTPWAFTQRDGPGPTGGYEIWGLTLPGGPELTVKLRPVPVTGCDHRYESHSYQPSDTLRHLVQVRDGTCTFPPCTRHARESDFEHATPYDRGGRTCACNAGARSRRCHRVKQSKGWSVTQPLPGWHRWTTPAGRTYTQGPMKYPI
jgi:uncharacterized protein DUF222